MATELKNTSPIGKPWRFTGTAMQPNALIMCKLLFILLVAHDFQDKLGDPYIPFLRVLDIFGQQPGLFALLSKTAFWLAGLALLINLKVRTAAITLGATIIVAILASKPNFQNHVFIVGCLFFLVGLHQRGERPWLIRYQFVVMYLGAFISKAFDPDWWTGDFMHTWLHLHLHNPFYETLSPLLPGMWFASCVSALVILSEFLLIFLFLFRRFNSMAVVLSIAMHLGFMVLVGRVHFGYFTEDILLAFLCFLAWPKTIVEVRLRASLTQRLKPVFFFVNWDKQFQLGELIEGKTVWLEIHSDDSVLTNTRALVYFLKYNPVFYVGLFFAFNGVLYVAARI